MCDEKVSYKSERLTKIAAHGFQDKYKGRKLRAYLCPNCHEYHLSSIVKHFYGGKRTKRAKYADNSPY